MPILILEVLNQSCLYLRPKFHEITRSNTSLQEFQTMWGWLTSSVEGLAIPMVCHLIHLRFESKKVKLLFATKKVPSILLFI